jgi:hypothetical protein
MNPDFVLSIEEPCEFYLPYIDTYVSRDSAPEALLYMGIIDRFGTRAEFIPFFSYVYHEYVTAFGESTSMDIDYAVGFYNQMARSLARTFIQGEIVKGAGTTSDKRHPEIFELYKHTAQAATSYAKSYVIRGIPLAPPHIDVPIRQIDWYNALSNEFGTPIFEPAVLHSAWLSDDGALGFAFVNWDTETIEFDVELPQYNGFLDTYSILMTCNGQKTILSYNATLPYSLHISMEQNDVLLIEVIHSTENLQPNKPILTGPPTGKINTEYNYFINATDPDNDTISYYVDWGDGTVTGWLGPYHSGTPISEPHTWQQTGSYAIKAKCKDVIGLESDWSDPLPVNMPLKTSTLWMIFLEFLHLFLFSIFNTSF